LPSSTTISIFPPRPRASPSAPRGSLHLSSPTRTGRLTGLTEAGRRRTASAAPWRLPNRGEEAGNSASPPHARGASSPKSVARVELSPRGVSPRCIMTGRHMPGLAQGAVSCRRLPHQHFCNRLHCKDHISKMSIWFSTTILLDEAADAAHRAVGSELTMVRHLRPASSRTAVASLTFTKRITAAAHADRQVATFFWSVGHRFVPRRTASARIDPLRGTALVHLRDQIQNRSANRPDK
jgi:hypothetical protein